MQRKLNDTAVRSAKPADGKPRKITDGGGLYLYVTNTSKSWRYNYRYQQKQKNLTFGLYPEISLSNAREMHDNARSRLARGMDPSKKEIAGKGAKFRDTAEEWFAMIGGRLVSDSSDAQPSLARPNPLARWRLFRTHRQVQSQR